MSGEDLPQWVAIIIALGGGGIIMKLWEHFAKNSERKSERNITDNDRLIDQLKTQLSKTEAALKEMSEDQKLLNGRMETLRERSLVLEIENTRMKAELQFLEKQYAEEEARSVELRAIVDNLRKKSDAK